jgi:large subunit ribosomal protein L21
MSKTAVIQFAGKQFNVKEGDVFSVERQNGNLSNTVLFFTDGKTTKVGNPDLKDVTVLLKEIEQNRAKKIRVARFKSKSRYRRVNGHRQPMSVVKVEEITVKSTSKPKTESKKDEAPKKETSKKKATKSTKEAKK